MNNKQAKRIKKEVYGDYSYKIKEYISQRRLNSKKEYIETGAIECNGLRKKYLDKKKQYKRRINNGMV